MIASGRAFAAQPLPEISFNWPIFIATLIGLSLLACFPITHSYQHTINARLLANYYNIPQHAHHDQAARPAAVNTAPATGHNMHAKEMSVKQNRQQWQQQ